MTTTSMMVAAKRFRTKSIDECCTALAVAPLDLGALAGTAAATVATADAEVEVDCWVAVVLAAFQAGVAAHQGVEAVEVVTVAVERVARYDLGADWEAPPGGGGCNGGGGADGGSNPMKITKSGR